ncbi:MAG: HAMP domain-containing protein [Ardenticatenaceae bacterium]|nr:HAMP domain-containing protein [Ardenticatenaceae bacterium]MCB9445026.1 HAMP domain-containing protein [Ardenticatenaceae bacterium]
MKIGWKRPSQLPLQWRLTLWYLFTLGVILLLFATFLYFQLRHTLQNQLDTALQLVASQAVINVDRDGGRLAFQNVENESGGTLTGDDFVIYLLAADGTIWEKSGQLAEGVVAPPAASGFTTTPTGDDWWRVFSQEVSADGVTGWIQIIGNMDPINDTMDRLLAIILLGIPLALLLAGAGGYFLAVRTLQPIDRMTQTAQTISASDLNRRIAYQGPADAVGRLAQTFDSMLDRLQTAFERERHFTGDAAHELRTPLAALKGRIGVTLGQPRRPEVYVETLQEMEGQVDRLVRLSSDLLFMARLEQGQMAGRRERIDLPDFLAAVVDQIRPLATAKAITLTETIPAGLSLLGDMDLLIRLFLNLLDNAVKYTPVNGRVTISAVQQKSELHVTITDSGPGIAAQHLPHLFERFYRVEDARSRLDASGSGAGLGLAIAFEIARAHGGSLRVASQPGQGAAFTAVFPQNSAAAGAAQ